MTTAVTSYGMWSMGINAPTMTGVVLAGLVDVVSYIAIPTISMYALSIIPAAEAKNAKCTDGKDGDVFVQCVDACDRNGKDAHEAANTGSVEISEARWNEFAAEAMLPNSILKLVLDRWVQDGDDGARFLIKVAPKRYSLGEAYKKESDFLTIQGELRKRQQKKAAISVNVRNKARNRAK